MSKPDLGPFVVSPETLLSIRQAFESLLQTRLPGLSSQRRLDLLIAFGELIQNIVRHEVACTSNGIELKVYLHWGPSTLRVELIDNAEEIADRSFLDHKVSTSEDGGMGLEILRSLRANYAIYPCNSRVGNRHLLEIPWSFEP